MSNPYRVDVLVREHVVEKDSDPFTDATGKIGYSVAHTQLVHNDLLDPAKPHAHIHMVRTIQLVSGALSVLLSALAEESKQDALIVSAEVVDQLKRHIADSLSLSESNPPPVAVEAWPGYDDLSEEHQASLDCLPAALKEGKKQ